MVSTIHSRTHQVYRTGIDADVLLVDMLLVDCLCNQMSIRGKHETAKLCEQADIAKSGRDKHLIEYLVHTFANLQDIIAFLIRCIRDTDTAGQVDVGKLDAGFFLQLNSDLEQDLCKGRVVVVCDRVTCKERMQTEFLRTCVTQLRICLEQLLLRHAVFGIAGVVHDGCGDREGSARIVTAEYCLRNTTCILQELYMCVIV